MPRSELRLAAHQLRPGEQVIEIWYQGEFIGQITAAEGGAVKLISKYLNHWERGPLIRDVDGDSLVFDIMGGPGKREGNGG